MGLETRINLTKLKTFHLSLNKTNFSQVLYPK